MFAPVIFQRNRPRFIYLFQWGWNSALEAQLETAQAQFSQRLNKAVKYLQVLSTSASTGVRYMNQGIRIKQPLLNSWYKVLANLSWLPYQAERFIFIHRRKSPGQQMPTKRRGSLSPGESMQRSEDRNTAAETLLPAGVLIPLTGGSHWLQHPEDPDLNFSEPYSFFL